MIYLVAVVFIAGTLLGIVTTLAVVSLLFAAQEIEELMEGKTPAPDQAQPVTE